MLKSYPTKPCRYCGNLGHWPYQCFKKPKPIKEKLFADGKIAKQWKITKKTWFRKNPPVMWPYPHYVCYICGRWLKPYGKIAGDDNPIDQYVTLDHVLSRSRHPELRFNLDNLQPCCHYCNFMKGSKDGTLKVK